jgi:hypothetical protein
MTPETRFRHDRPDIAIESNLPARRGRQHPENHPQKSKPHRGFHYTPGDRNTTIQ